MICIHLTKTKALNVERDKQVYIALTRTEQSLNKNFSSKIQFCNIPSRPPQQQRDLREQENRWRVHICVHVFWPDTCTSGDLSASAKEKKQQIENTDLKRERVGSTGPSFPYLCRDKEKRAEEPPEYPIENYAASLRHWSIKQINTKTKCALRGTKL